MSSPLSVAEADVPLSHDLPVWRDVLCVPWGTNEPKGAQRSAGLFDQNGVYIEQAVCKRWGDDSLTIQPEFELTEPAPIVPGRWLYGGMLYGHFGHFLCESTGRFWAMDHISEPVDGIFWLPKIFMGHPVKMVRPYKAFLEALGHSKIQLSAPQFPTRFEQVIIPEQGFGIGQMAAGRPEYRDFMRNNLGRKIAKGGGKRVYVSRAGLPMKRGSILMEDWMETLFAQEGYDIIRPEDLPVADQIARYKAARWIVGPDGSALHLAAMVARPKTRVAIINRGPSQNIEDYARQFRHFSGIEVLQLEAISAYWFHEGRRVVRRETHALMNFPLLSSALKERGFIKGAIWQQPDDSMLNRAIEDRETRFKARLQRYAMDAPA